MPDRFSQVSPGIFRGGQPTPEELRLLAEVHGVKRVVSLDGPIGAEISAICHQLGIDHLIIPIGGPETKEFADFLQENLSEVFEEQPLYIHCRHGKDRTGMAVGMYRIQEEGWDPKEALAEALSFDFGSGLELETKDFYQSYFQNHDSNDLQDYRHPNYESAYDALMPAPYRKNQMAICFLQLDEKQSRRMKNAASMAATFLSLASLEDEIAKLDISDEVKDYIINLSDPKLKGKVFSQVKKNPELSLEELKQVQEEITSKQKKKEQTKLSSIFGSLSSRKTMEKRAATKLDQAFSAQDDIVSSMRDQFNMGDVPPAFNPQQSFSVLDDYKFAPPGEQLQRPPPEMKDFHHFLQKMKLPPSEEEQTRRKIRKDILQELAQKLAPEVGQYDNYDGIRGAGPGAGNEETGGFAASERGATPGVAPVETGGWLNL